MALVYDKEIIGYINTFENVSKVKIKDCYKSENSLIFIVDMDDARRAIGRNGLNVKKLAAMLRKKIKVVGFSSDVLTFVKNLIAPVNSKIYKEDEGVIAIKTEESKDKGIIIGRDRRNINEIQNIVSRYFNVKIKVI